MRRGRRTGTYNAAGKHNACKSTFFCLPGELRNMIYSHFLSQQIYTFSDRLTDDRKIRLASQSAGQGETSNRIALLSTCRQIYFEAKKLVSSHTTFRFSSLSTFTRLGSHMSADKRALMTKIHLQATHACGYFLVSGSFAELLPNANIVLLDIYPGPHPWLNLWTLLPLVTALKERREEIESWIMTKEDVKFDVRFLDEHDNPIEDPEWRGHTLW
ncbi:hypothetical protein FB567DRAFT_526160 [Paraphoma chrysanthemicola]|uniref:DUF7730 domain-containing protein n=1 Tax=Paraphoma chrysanthemicola TaxID=798071 RepID=A0A8K0R527_9PLEO|nr:hypothetical protein FB567DRAFT_526160 [Paraphoma chrysanthemicola]